MKQTDRHGIVWQARAEAVRKGEVVNHDSFDSNCITPGTPFMARLGAHFRYFVRRKIAEDPAWQRPHIIFSGTRLSAALCSSARDSKCTKHSKARVHVVRDR